ncbi:MAG: PIN domain nuclease [Treponema sp.]|jgi:hypothetical protein|nr:PIN domain nuclease [Treponema sp.]
MRILIDTPNLVKSIQTQKINFDDKNIIDSLKYLISEFMEVIIGPIRQELLSGISNENTFNELKGKMEYFNDSPIETTDYELTDEYSNICRKHGTQGSNIDFLICTIAVRNSFEIFTMLERRIQPKHYAKWRINRLETILTEKEYLIY